MTPATPQSESQMQRRFVKMVGDLITWCYANGYELTFGEAYRTPEQAALDAKKGTGIAHSLHTDRLAIDLNLFIGGEYKTATTDYLPLGMHWEDIGGAWGGRFSHSDGNHFSLAWDGRK